jgi:hypothetical protein
MDVRMASDGEYTGSAEGDSAIVAQAEVLKAHIRSQMILRLGLYILAAFLMVVASVLVVFAPPGREAVTTIVGLALFAVALGSAGFSAFAIKAPFVSASAGSEVPSLQRHRVASRSRAGPG